MTDDIPKKTVMILVVVALIVSVLSTTLVINAVYTSSPVGPISESTPEGVAKVQLSVGGGEPGLASGRVVFTVNGG